MFSWKWTMSWHCPVHGNEEVKNIILLIRFIWEILVSTNGIPDLEESFYAVLFVSKCTKYLNFFWLTTIERFYLGGLFRRTSADLCKDKCVQCSLPGPCLGCVQLCSSPAFPARISSQTRTGVWLSVHLGWKFSNNIGSCRSGML